MPFPLPALALLLGLACVSRASLTYRGVDWSSVSVEEAAGISYKTASGTTEPLEKILVANGVNTVRQRVWVNPSGGTYGLPYNIALGKRAKAVGLGVYLDLHFSDTWADAGHQAIPSGWPTDIDNLSWELYNYTLMVSNQFQSAGVQPEIISIGNESNQRRPPVAHRHYFVVFQHCKAATLGCVRHQILHLNPQPKIMVHLPNGWDWSLQQYFYTTVLKQGTFTTSDFDIMGVSYYPFYGSGATLASLKSSLNNMASTWGKSIIVAETDWPTSCPSPSQSFPSDTAGIPFSAAGQSTFVKDLANVVSGVRGGSGLFYWEPAWVQNANLGSSCANNLMVSSSGQALSSLSVFESI